MTLPLDVIAGVNRTEGFAASGVIDFDQHLPGPIQKVQRRRGEKYALSITQQKPVASRSFSPESLFRSPM
jgi:hypothetical protein